mmetsp:Transcript_43777/g.103450  ORF Transcript_43777/g.103450 Transcript_43777/m.103450 type:complete len:240 (+) Transcript_43777:147-866(+)
MLLVASLASAVAAAAVPVREPQAVQANRLAVARLPPLALLSRREATEARSVQDFHLAPRKLLRQRHTLSLGRMLQKVDCTLARSRRQWNGALSAFLHSDRKLMDFAWMDRDLVLANCGKYFAIRTEGASTSLRVGLQESFFGTWVLMSVCQRTPPLRSSLMGSSASLRTTHEMHRLWSCLAGMRSKSGASVRTLVCSMKLLAEAWSTKLWSCEPVWHGSSPEQTASCPTRLSYRDGALR